MHQSEPSDHWTPEKYLRFQRAVMSGPSQRQFQRLEETSATGRFPELVVAEIERAVAELQQFPGQVAAEPEGGPEAAVADAGGSSTFAPVGEGHLTGHAQPESEAGIANWGCDAVLCLLSTSARDLHQVSWEREAFRRAGITWSWRPLGGIVRGALSARDWDAIKAGVDEVLEWLDAG